jgi:hypothetical protein
MVIIKIVVVVRRIKLKKNIGNIKKYVCVVKNSKHQVEMNIVQKNVHMIQFY